MRITNRLTQLLGVRYPIIQAGMVWVSGWKLASAVSNKGGLGLIGSGSMKPDLLKEHIKKCKNATVMPFGVNVPLLRGDAEDLINIALEEEVNVFFTSAGHPGKHIDLLKRNSALVVHVVSSVKQGLKAAEAGCDAVVGEGVEAGGHNGPDEITTFCLIPQLADALNIPVIAAGGIADGRGILAAFALGAEGVQIGTRFAVTEESSAHPNYKRAVLEAKDNSTTLIMRKIGMARLLKNKFSEEALKTEFSGAGKEELLNILGKKREKLGIFDGDFDDGMMEAGQGAGLIEEILSVDRLMDDLIDQFDRNLVKISNLNRK